MRHQRYIRIREDYVINIFSLRAVFEQVEQKWQLSGLAERRNILHRARQRPLRLKVRGDGGDVLRKIHRDMINVDAVSGVRFGPTHALESQRLVTCGE